MTGSRDLLGGDGSLAAEPENAGSLAGGHAVLPQSRRVRASRAISGWLIRHAFPGADLLRRRLAYLVMPAPRGPVVVPMTLGGVLVVDPIAGRGVEREIYYQGVYEAGTLSLLANVLRPGDVFIDVGANIGLVSIVASRLVGARGRVCAFEPVPNTVALLEQNIALNGAHNISVESTALGAVQETRAIYEHPEVNRGAASLVPSEGSPSSAIVPVTTLDGYVHRAGLEGRIRAVKIDVEGWEADVLAGGRETLAASAGPVLIVEYSTNVRLAKGAHTDVYDFLSSVKDYRVFCLKRGKESISGIREIRGRGDLPREDNLICLRPDHLKEERLRSLLLGG
jgi:FkbM family methyltransferase